MIPVQEANPEGRKFQFLRRGQGFIQTKYGRVKYPRLPSSNPAGTMPLIQSNPTDPPENRPPSDSGCHELEEGSLQTNRTSSSEMTMHDYDTTAAFEHLEQRISAESTPMQGLGHGRPRVTEVRATGGTSDRESVESGELGSLTSSNWNQRPTITPSPSLQEPYEGQQQRRDRLAPPASTLPSTVVDGDGRSAPTVQPFAPLPPSLRRFPPPPPVFNPPLHFPLPQRNQPNSWVPRPSPLLNDYFTNTEQRPVHPFAVGVRPVEQQRLADQLRAMIAQLDLDQAACKRAREEFEKVKAQMAEERAESRREVDAL
uniref:Uncharacterized protein n=1 Tax=Plectus sambesii TaxID=2011161 RepID=A0A914W0V1_9BILA